MKVLMIASEVAPFAKTGGLADVLGALPRELKQRGHDVRIIMPFYREVEGAGVMIRKGRKSVEVPVGGTLQKGLLRQAALGDIPLYLLEHRGYFHREYLYGGPEGDYPDNAERFAFFCRGVIEVIKKLDFRPDVLHCHDWQTALVPLILKHELGRDPFYSRTATLFTIHNLGYQGLFPASALPQFGLDPSLFTMEGIEFYGQINLLKGAIQSATVITTVSPTYCTEITTAEYGCGLEGVLRKRTGDLYGILNGIDTAVWNPATDREIVRNFTSSALSGKAANKIALQNQLGLEQNPGVPLVAVVSRLASQKGMDLILDLLPRFSENNVQLALLGAGDERFASRIRSFQGVNRTFAATIGFESTLAHRMYAGSDIFLMPSRYEPCGLGQMIALKYGSVPVVRHTGGLADTVRDPRQSPRDANGFDFEQFDSDELWQTVTRAVELYRNSKAEWKKMVRRGMQADFSWHRAAEKYEELYEAALTGKKVR